MAFTVSEFRDLIQLLEQHPAWREELRRWVLTEELLALPQMVRELTDLQRQTGARMGQLAGHVDALSQHVDTLVQQTVQLTTHVAEQAQRFDRLLIHISDLSQRMEQ